MSENVIDSADTDTLAAEYVLGTLDFDERNAAQSLLAQDAAFAAKVKVWERRLGELHLMVEPVNHMLHNFAQVLEIQEQSRFVEIFAGQRHPDLIVVSVRILALAFVVAKVVPRGKRIFYRNFEHEPSVEPKKVPIRQLVLYR